jgi:mono/diheme cytochrome c family protein
MRAKKNNKQTAILLAALFFIVSGYTILQDDWVVPEKFKNMENPYAQVEDEDEIGKDLYSMHCRSCHGKTGLGDGSKAFELESDVKDFTSKAFKSQSDGSIYFKIIIGRDEMPSFDKKIREEEDRWMLVNYVKSF